MSLETPRDILGAFGISESFWDSLQDGVPLQDQERELLLRLLFYSTTFQPADLESWQQPPPQWHADGDYRPLRGQVLSVDGRVTEVIAETVSPEVAERLGFTRFYRCTLRADNGTRYLVYARQIPRGWRDRQVLDERATLKGLFLKLAAGPPDLEPVLVTFRPAWYPRTLLGQLGMDCGLFDDVAVGRTDRRFVPGQERPDALDTENPLQQYRLTGRDRECFYQLLAAVGRAEPGQLVAAAKQELADSGQSRFSVVPLFNDAPRQQGKLFLLYGTARRIERVEVQDKDIRDRFGITHYYTIYLFTDDSQNYPIVFCVRFLPDHVPLGEGPGYAVNLAVAGFFMKTWAFRPTAALAPEAPRHAWQLAPLLVGREALMLAPERTPQRVGLATTILVAVVTAVVVFVAGTVWWFNRRDRQRQRTLRELLSATPPSLPDSGA